MLFYSGKLLNITCNLNFQDFIYILIISPFWRYCFGKNKIKYKDNDSLFIFYSTNRNWSLYKNPSSCDSILFAVYFCSACRNDTWIKRRCLSFIALCCNRSYRISYIYRRWWSWISIAFIAAPYIVGLTREKFGTQSVGKLIAGCILAMLVTYLIGTVYTYFILKDIMHNPIPYWACLASLFPFAIAKDIFSCIVVSLVAPRLLKIVNSN